MSDEANVTNAAFAVRVMRGRKDGSTEEAWFSHAVTRRSSVDLANAMLFPSPDVAIQAASRHGYQVVSVVLVGAMQEQRLPK